MNRALLQMMLAVFFASSAPAGWTDPVRISAPGGVYYPQILAQGDTLHVAYSNNDQGWKIGYVQSTNGGETWSEQKVLSDDSSETVFVRIIDNRPKLMVLWRNNYYYGGAHSRNIGYNISYNNGLSWSGPRYILDPGWEHILYFSASGSGQVVNVILSRSIGYDLFFYSIRSTDFGQSWSEPVEMFASAMSSLIDQVSFDGMVHFVWSGFFNWDESGDVYYMRSTDDGLSWSENSMLSENDQVISELPSICTNETGNVACAWWDFKYSPYGTTGDILLRQSMDQGETWLNEEQITAEHWADWSDVVWTNGSLYVVWQDWRFGLPTVFYTSSPDSVHDWSNVRRLEDDPADSETPAVAVSNGNVYVVWADERCDPDTDICGGVYFTKLESEVAVDEGKEDVLPNIYRLDAYPNPFNSNVMLSLKIEEGGDIGITIYDLCGRIVKELFKGGNLEKGTHNFTWDATDALGKTVGSGPYFAVACTPWGKAITKITLLR